MSIVQQAVFNHLDIDASGALLITGGWGAGKTYYIDNELFPLIQDKTQFKPIRVSLFGEQDTKSISSKILQELVAKKIVGVPNVMKTIKSIGKSLPIISKYVNVEELVNLIGGGLFEILKTNKVALFFDDLERLGKNLSKNDFLGYVNDLVENKKCKVFVIANKDKIDTDYSYEEKAITKTIVFQPNIKKVLQHLINKGNDTVLKDFLNKETSFFLDSLNPKHNVLDNELSDECVLELEEDLTNLRSVQAAFSQYEFILKKLKEHLDFENHKTTVQLHNLWTFILAISIESRKPDGLTLKNRKGIDTSISRFSLALFYINNKNDAKSKESKSTTAIFKDKYFGRLAQPYHFYKEVYEFIVSGKDIDISILTDQLNENFKYVDNKQAPHLELFQECIGETYTIANEDFPRKLAMLLDYTSKGKYDKYEEYVTIATFLIPFSKYFNPPITEDNLIASICIGVTLYTQRTDYRSDWHLLIDEQLESYNDPNAKQIIDHISKVAQEKENELLDKEIVSLEQLLYTDPNEFVATIEGHRLHLITSHTSIFHRFDIDAFIGHIKDWNVNNVLIFTEFLNTRYLKRSIDYHKEEHQAMLTLFKAIQQFDTSEKLLTNFYIDKKLKPTAQRALERLQNHIDSKKAKA